MNTKDNVFSDLGFSSEESEKLKIRSDLMNEIVLKLENMKLNNPQSAEKLGIPKSMFSDLVNGKLGCFSLDILVYMLRVLNCED